ncbi:MAG TPA: cation:proton antiporter [Gammaproteobacteria bacterium]|nr:cation:proton antiporter [Gammaproteobacteria bacterium]
MLTELPISLIVLSSGLLLILIGLWGMLMQHDLIRIIIGFSLMDTGIHMTMVAIGYVTGGTAPIINDAVAADEAVNLVVDPVPSALVLTAIVIGLGVTAVMLSFAVRIYKTRKTLMIDKLTELK